MNDFEAATAITEVNDDGRTFEKGFSEGYLLGAITVGAIVFVPRIVQWGRGIFDNWREKRQDAKPADGRSENKAQENTEAPTGDAPTEA